MDGIDMALVIILALLVFALIGVELFRFYVMGLELKNRENRE